MPWTVPPRQWTAPSPLARTRSWRPLVRSFRRCWLSEADRKDDHKGKQDDLKTANGLEDKQEGQLVQTAGRRGIPSHDAQRPGLRSNNVLVLDAASLAM